MSIGTLNLRDALANVARSVLQGNWVCGSGSSASAIVAQTTSGLSVNLSPGVQATLVGAVIEVRSGPNAGMYRSITAISSSGSLSLDEPLEQEPNAGDVFVLLSGMEPVSVRSTPIPATCAAGSVTVGTAAVQLPSQASVDVYLQASASNTGTISVGSSSDQTLQVDSGTPTRLSISNLSALYAIASAADQVLNWFATVAS